MKIVPYRKGQELRPMGTMLSIFDDFFNRAFEEENGDDNFRSMAMDIVEHDKEFEILANLPGFRKENVKISVHDNQLLIEAKCEQNKEETKGTVYRCERYSGSYRRNLLLPENSDLAKISAKMEDGVLQLLIPKKEPSPQKEIVIE
ncbi:MAG: Hsp20/alpha crystallin family protein [Candidatus Cloacimonetes bacterium]|nr:Hsp20/alpha crystallin family protein [Candidatus Cloacimonadota bacterium]MDD3142718.1 Hsp20/alpha crystallin family protein [Candidatus Cloacimonadota bacterium]MDY0367027.1 Hsp20/alpha crystallin family protein [Candidatus Syntrophosphaera sp.]HOY85137.1 Hsp20/alpha crystallin family protein [Candidatus Syntrophosphaera sp.]